MSKVSGVSILIAAHNRCELLARTLESLARVELPRSGDGERVPVECIVVANACTDDTVGVVERMAKGGAMPFPLRVVEEPRRGVSFARNRAVAEAAAGHELMVFIDSDCLADPAWLVEHVRMYAEHGADLVTGKIELWWERGSPPAGAEGLTRSMREALGEHDRGGKEPVRLEEPCAYAANFSFRRAVFEKAGPFRTDIGRSGSAGRLAHEETVLARNAMRAGFSFWWSPRAVVKHWAPESSLRGDFFARSAYWGSVSSVLTAEPFGAGAAAGIAVKSPVRMALCAARRAWAAVRGDAAAGRAARMDLCGAAGRLRGLLSRVTGLGVPRG